MPVPRNFAKSRHASELAPDRGAVLSTTFQDRFLTNDLLFSIIFSFCSPATIIRFSRTCRIADLVVKSYMKRTYRIERILSRFLSDPLKFRRLQAGTGTLISGSAALQFFDRSFYPESDLDLYVHVQFAKEVGIFLLEDGYVFAPNSVQEDDFAEISDEQTIRSLPSSYTFKGVSCVFTFEKKHHSSGEPLKVQLIVGTHCPMEVILYFHSTCVMNVISFETAYSLYPKATFEKRQSLVCPGTGRDEDAALQKYENRGWTMATTDLTWARDLEPCFHIVYHRVRFMGDSFCWTIPLDISMIPDRLDPGEGSPRLLKDPAAATSWTLDYSVDDWGCISIQRKSNKNLYLHYITSCKDMLQSLEESPQTRRRVSEPRYTALKLIQRKKYYDAAYVSMCMMSFRFNSDMQALLRDTNSYDPIDGFGDL
ncbi:hypothetical protein QCA50_000735 [Cerrena zonata]|uniref:Uncharacterized protein n=1 Tax=Cerrena zonata TaxID=2478898 RepID=A0AAW0GVC0_9APHY